MSLVPVGEALARLLADARPVDGVEVQPLAAAAGRVAAEDLTAAMAVPPFANSAMDGYAVDSRGLAAGSVLPVQDRVAAGQVGSPLQPGAAARIFTGAPLPPGADAVVMQEHCLLEPGVPPRIRLQQAPQPGQHVRPAGQDLAEGQLLVRRGQRLSAAHLGLLASVGRAEVAVQRRVRVALLSTGNELREPGQPLAEGMIYNSNRPVLGALLQRLGCEVIDGGHVPDAPEATEQALTAAAVEADCILTSGGVSVGEGDQVRRALERLGELLLWQLAIKPGKPLAYGRLPVAGRRQTVPVLGLPGNPASAFVTFGLLARPYLLALQGRHQPEPRAWVARAAFDWPRPGRRQEYLRVRLQAGAEGELEAELYPNQSSGVLASVAWSNALAVVAPGTTVSRGQQIPVLPLSELELV